MDLLPSVLSLDEGRARRARRRDAETIAALTTAIAEARASEARLRAARLAHESAIERLRVLTEGVQ